MALSEQELGSSPGLLLRREKEGGGGGNIQGQAGGGGVLKDTEKRVSRQQRAEDTH